MKKIIASLILSIGLIQITYSQKICDNNNDYIYLDKQTLLKDKLIEGNDYYLLSDLPSIDGFGKITLLHKRTNHLEFYYYGKSNTDQSGMIIGYKAKMTADSLYSFEEQFIPINGTIEKLKNDTYYRRERECVIMRMYRMNTQLNKFFYEYVVINRFIYDKIKKENPLLTNNDLFFDTDYFCESPSY